MNTIFIHIPKTAGSTLIEIARRNTRQSNAFFLDGDNPKSSIQRLIIQSDTEKQKRSFIMGHMDFGLHEHFSQEFYYLTMLRNPVNRIISHYHYAKSETNHYLHAWIHQNNIDLKQYVESGISIELDNGMVRMLSGNGGFHKEDHESKYPPFGECTEQMLNAAIENLKTHFIFIGLQEQFDESLLLLAKKLGWNKVFYKSRNVLQKKYHIEKDIQKVIKARNYLDIRLYQFAQKRLSEEITKNKIYLSIHKPKLKLLNRLYSEYLSFSS